MQKDQMVIYHNIEDEKIYVKVPEGVATHFQLQNLAGKIIAEAVHAEAFQDFDLTDLPEGNYFVIVNQDDVIRSKKIQIGFND
ncbi:MAG: T9SS type A sorting domain-containing protein [Spirosomaceae bacterium]|nr:T9SS type A sorting domain-containing protein [Spirosomataceae bacterium]MDP5139663.1 T9SS type A sorting domain-containing protein [Spirosomataceae bacterium]